MQLESGIGNGKLAGVDADNRLLTASFNIPFEHLIGKDYQKTFYALGTATPINGTTNVMYLRNDNQRDYMVISRFILQAVGLSGGTAVPNASNYFRIDFDADYTSGGTAVTPVNLTSGSAVVSNVTCYDSGATATGVETGRYYPYADAGVIDLQTEAAVIIPPSKGILISYTGDNTAGVASAQVVFQVVSSTGYSG